MMMVLIKLNQKSKTHITWKPPLAGWFLLNCDRVEKGSLLEGGSYYTRWLHMWVDWTLMDFSKFKSIQKFFLKSRNWVQIRSKLILRPVQSGTFFLESESSPVWLLYKFFFFSDSLHSFHKVNYVHFYSLIK